MGGDRQQPVTLQRRSQRSMGRPILRSQGAVRLGAAHRKARPSYGQGWSPYRRVRWARRSLAQAMPAQETPTKATRAAN